MFTGLIEEIGTIKNIQSSSTSAELTIICTTMFDDIDLGASIAVNGICLTVTHMTRDSFSVDVMPETMKISNLKHLKISDKVNLERALSLKKRLGGHFVSGHADGVGSIKSIQKNDNAFLIKINTDPSILKYIIHRGSITIDGISLTVCDLEEDDFSVSIIPHTFAYTTLNFKKVGDLVNLENDMIAKYIERLLTFDDQTSKKNLTIDFLKENGF
ncbi:MAG: riboflavin synthase [Brevinema sp.]